MLDKTSTIEILICTHNRAGLLKRAVNYINMATRPQICQLSLFIVANACTDETIQFLQGYQDKAATDPSLLPLKWMEQPVSGKSNALNMAIPNLTGDLIAMVDDDHRVDANYFTAIETALLQYPKADFLCGKIIPDWDGSEPNWVHDQGKYRIYPLPVPRFDLGENPIQVTREIAVPGGGNLVIKRELFEQTGNFSNNFGPVGHNLSGGEDFDWVTRAYKAGAKLQYIPNLIQFHYVDSERLNLYYIIKKAFERSSSVARLSEEAKMYSGLFPRYLFRKTLGYFISSLLSFSNSKRRFYMVRLAAALGEMKGFLLAEKNSHE